MTKRQIRSLTIAVALGAVALLAVLYGMRTVPVHAPPAIPPESLGRLVPSKNPPPVSMVAFHGIDGQRHTLAEFKGHYVLLNLWATWCAPCVRELPALARLQAALPHHRLNVVAVDVARDTPASAAEFLKGHGALKLAVYVDSGIALMRAFGAYGLPLSVLIDDKGHEIARAVGPAEWDAPEAIRYFAALTEKAPS